MATSAEPVAEAVAQTVAVDPTPPECETAAEVVAQTGAVDPQIPESERGAESLVQAGAVQPPPPGCEHVTQDGGVLKHVLQTGTGARPPLHSRCLGECTPPYCSGERPPLHSHCLGECSPRASGCSWMGGSGCS